MCTFGPMSDLIAIAYPDESKARDVARALADLTRQKTLSLDDLVVVTRNDKGKVKLHQSFSPAGAGAAGGALWGGLIGLIFLQPLLGMAIGAASGGAVNAFADYGVDDGFMKTLGARLDNGGAAVIALVRQVTVDKVLPEIAQFGGEVLHSSLGNESEETLQAALSGAAQG